jgi:hypothetical protein
VAAPLTVARNNYIERPKRSDIPTPRSVAHFIASLYPDVRSVLDPCAGKGQLLQPFADRGVPTVRYEIEDGQDFLSDDSPVSVDLVVCNPPFNVGTGRRLSSEVWLEHIITRCGFDTPVSLVTPMGLRLNQRIASARWPKMRDSWPQIDSILALPLNIFPSVEFHVEVLFFNSLHLRPHYFLPQWSLALDGLE